MQVLALRSTGRLVRREGALDACKAHSRGHHASRKCVELLRPGGCRATTPRRLRRQAPMHGLSLLVASSNCSKLLEDMLDSTEEDTAEW